MIGVLLACAPVPEVSLPEEAAPLAVAALSPPVGWLAERIGGDDIVVTQLSPAGADPATWHPTGAQVVALDGAAIVLANGAGYEAWTATAALPPTVVDTTEALSLRPQTATTHSHGDGAHSHAETDPHTWIDPAIFAGQADAVLRALIAADPDHTAAYETRAAALRAELTALGEALDAALVGARGRRMAANHPSYGYLADRTGLDLTAIDLDPGAPPSEAQRSAFAAWRGDDATPLLWWEAPPDEAVTEALGEGVLHLFVDPLEHARDGRYDYLAQAETNVALFRTTFAAP